MYKSIPPFMIAASMLLAPAVSHAENNTGNIDLELGLGFVVGEEMAIREPEMCEGESRAKVMWNENADNVSIKLELEGIPYEPSFCFEFDPSNDYNEYPLCVEDGAWQMWFLTRLFTRTSTFYYDLASGDLLGNINDLPAGPPPGSVPAVVPVVQMVCSPFFQPNPHSLKANVQFDFGYDVILDAIDSPGTLAGLLPFNLYDEDSWWFYYTYSILPPAEAASFDDVLADIEAGSSFVISTSVEPKIKPPSLLTHDQIMIGWTGGYPEGTVNPLPSELFDDPDCGTEQISIPFPGGVLPL